MRHVHILKKLENNHFIFKTVFVHVPQARVLKNQINIQCKGAQNVIQDLHFSSEPLQVRQARVLEKPNKKIMLQKIFIHSHILWIQYLVHYSIQIYPK